MDSSVQPGASLGLILYMQSSASRQAIAPAVTDLDSGPTGAFVFKFQVRACRPGQVPGGSRRLQRRPPSSRKARQLLTDEAIAPVAAIVSGMPQVPTRTRPINIAFHCGRPFPSGSRLARSIFVVGG